MSAKRLISEKFSLLFRSILEMGRQIRTLRIWRATGIKMRTLMSLKLHDVGHGRRAVLELFRPPSPQMPTLDSQAAIKRRTADFRARPEAVIAACPMNIATCPALGAFLNPLLAMMLSVRRRAIA